MYSKKNCKIIQEKLFKYLSHPHYPQPEGRSQKAEGRRQKAEGRKYNSFTFENY